MADYSPHPTYSESPQREYRREEPLFSDTFSAALIDELRKSRKEMKRCRKIFKNAKNFKSVPGLYKGLQECAITLLVALISKGAKKL